MSCNCATQEQIKKLHQLYGDKSTEKIPFEQKVNNFFRKSIIGIIILCVSPLLISFVIYKAVFTKDKRISVRKLLRFNKKGIDEAIAKNIIENTNILDND